MREILAMAVGFLMVIFFMMLKAQDFNDNKSFVDKCEGKGGIVLLNSDYSSICAENNFLVIPMGE